MSKLLGIELARGLAALLVVLYHGTIMLAPEKYLGAVPLGGWFRFGHAGVDLFFVLSGFIIYFIHAGELGERRFWGGYCVKRFARIFPTYWVVLAGYGLVLAYSPTQDRYERDPVAVVANIFLIPQTHFPILGVVWSLSHELLFYALFSVSFFSRSIGRLVMIVWGALICVNMTTGWLGDSIWGAFAFGIFNAEFFFGLLIAWLALNTALQLPGRVFLAGTVLFFSTGVYEAWSPGVPIEEPPLHLAYASGTAAMLYGLVGLEKAGRLRLPGFAVAMGEASYSIYLLHIILIMAFQQAILLAQKAAPLPVTPTFLVVVLATVVISMAFSRLVEQPLLKKARRTGKWILGDSVGAPIPNPKT